MYKRASLFSMILVFGLMLAACAPAAAPEEEAPAADTEAAAEESAEETEGGEAAAVVVVAPGEPIRIGGSFALTGPIPDPGLDIQQAAEISVADVNAAGGIEGFQYELVAEDGACDGTQGTAVANKFAADEAIVAVSGGTCSGETFGLIPVLQKARIPFVSPSATNPDVTSEDCDVCNRVALSDAAQSETDAEYAVSDLGITSAAVMHDNSDYGKGLAELFMASSKDCGGEVTAFEGIQVGDTDFRAALAKLAADA
jgi:branched-chain amino acid transport system substrate-binding protein